MQILQMYWERSTTYIQWVFTNISKVHSGNVSFHKQVEMLIANFTKMHSGTTYLKAN